MEALENRFCKSVLSDIQKTCTFVQHVPFALYVLLVFNWRIIFLKKLVTWQFAKKVIFFEERRKKEKNVLTFMKI